MVPHWTYKHPTDRDVLEQGDVLRKSEALTELLRNYHPYYADHEANRFFLVLTQSCDLVRRGGACKARYVTLAPVRPLTKIVHYELSNLLNSVDGQAYASRRVLADVQRFLARLFNNNEPSYFYLEAENGAGIYDHMCGMLALPISFKVEHYDDFIDAKLIGIKEEFQAKLGWLLGQQFSRVGTQDWADKISLKVDSVTDQLAVWVDETSIGPLKRLIEQYRAENPGATIDQKTLSELLLRAPNKKQQVVDAVIEEAAKLGLVEDPKGPTRRKLRVALNNSSDLAVLLR